MCASMLFPNKDGRFCFRSSWRARESEIFTLALRGLKKKTEARRLETIFDSTLCKVYTGEAGSGGGAADSVLQSTTDKRPSLNIASASKDSGLKLSICPLKAKQVKLLQHSLKKKSEKLT